MVWPRVSPAFSAITRDMTSGLEPGPNGTINVSGFAGHLSAARAGIVTVRAKAATRLARISLRIVLSTLLRFSCCIQMAKCTVGHAISAFYPTQQEEK